MRPVLYSDVSAAARVLTALPEPARRKTCVQMIEQADIADRYVRRMARLHPMWGNGTLAAVARLHSLGPEHSFDDPAFSQCFALVLHSLRARRAEKGHVSPA
ncbi:MAG: hypothetical protein AAF755_09510 [Pseudomonadota bacterium]